MANDDKEHGGWQLIGDKVYDSFDIFRIRRSLRKNPRTGEEIPFVLMDGLDWCNVIALTEDNQVVLVKQYRHGAEQFTIEIPGGCVEKNEDPKTAALRELREETGYLAEEAELLGYVYPNPAMQAMRCYHFLARGVKRSVETALDPGEDIQVLTKPLEEVVRMVLEGEITHGLHVNAFGLMKLRGYL